MKRNAIGLGLALIFAGTVAWSQTPGPAQAHMESLDTNGNGVGEYSEFTALYTGMNRAIFNRIDMNGDGVVQQAELDHGPAQQILDTLGNTPWLPDVMADLDEDGCVCYPEIAAVLPGFPESTFKSLDLDGDGNLDLIEFNTDKAQEIISAWEDRTIFLDFKAVDTNRDGVLGLDELRTALPNYDVEAIEDIDSVAAVKTDTRTIYYPVARLTK